jgi:hypothetical protein
MRNVFSTDLIFASASAFFFAHLNTFSGALLQNSRLRVFHHHSGINCIGKPFQFPGSSS